MNPTPRPKNLEQMYLRAVLGILLLIVLSFSGCGPTPVGEDPATPVAYARLKKPSTVITHRSELPAGIPQPYPDHGVVLVQGNFFAPGPEWIIVDFDAKTITRLLTISADPTHIDLTHIEDGQKTKISKVVRPISDAELNRVIRQANEVWAPTGEPLPPPYLITDSSCEVYLLDGDDVLRFVGPTCSPATLRLLGAFPKVPLAPMS